LLTRWDSSQSFQKTLPLFVASKCRTLMAGSGLRHWSNWMNRWQDCSSSRYLSNISMTKWWPSERFNTRFSSFTSYNASYIACIKERLRFGWTQFILPNADVNSGWAFSLFTVYSVFRYLGCLEVWCWCGCFWFCSRFFQMISSIWDQVLYWDNLLIISGCLGSKLFLARTGTICRGQKILVPLQNYGFLPSEESIEFISVGLCNPSFHFWFICLWS
jgi:hypothetical protein